MNASKDHVPDVAASLRQRLLNWSRERRTDFQLTLVRYASERFLYRLSRSAEAERFILKGALLLRLWTEQEFRPTRDVDFLGLGSEDHEAIRSAIEEICSVDCPEDGLEFDHTMMRVESIRDGQEYGGVRVKLQGRLGVTRIPLQVDIGFGDVVTPAPIEENYPTLLDLPAPRLKTYPRETFIAEKFEAMVRLGPSNSRMKDFWDVAAVAQQFAFDGEVLCQAIKATFTRRGTPLTKEVPEALRPAFYQDAGRINLWRSFQQRVQPGIPMPTSFNAVGELVMSFLMPIRDNLVEGQVFRMAWPPGGPWRSSAANVGAEAQETRDLMAQVKVESQKTTPWRFRPYPEYKDSGVEWLGSVPYEWQVKRLKRLFKVENGATPKSGVPEFWDGDIPWVTPDDLGALRWIELQQPRRYITQEGYRSCGTTLVPAGSLVLSTRAPIGHLAIAAIELCTNQGCRSLKFRNGSHRRYFYYELLAAHPVLESWGQGSTFKELAKNKLEAMWLVEPSVIEQDAIATFLDRETAKIDAMVAKKQRLIELLQEKRTALITRTVTKGLDPNVPMKDSGVEWLGEIPAHWEVAPIYARYEVALGKMLDAKRVTGEHLGPYLRNIDVQWGHVNVEDLPQMDFAPAERDRYSLKPGDLLVCEGGEVGRTAIWRGELEECFYQKAIHRVRPASDRDEPRFFYYVMYSAAKCGLFFAGGNPNTIDHLTAVQMRHYRFQFPPGGEQRKIADHLDVETSRLDVLAHRIFNGIDRLKEFRTALISAAVTGKIDVRDSVAESNENNVRAVVD